MTPRILVLAGTAEARHLCEQIANLDLLATASLAGATRNPAALPVNTRIGGFGGVEGLTNWLRHNEIGAVIDATHPFARQMPWSAHRACEELGVPLLRLLRAAFPPADTDHRVRGTTGAASALPTGARAFLTTGRREIAAFEARRDCTFVLRSIDPAGPVPDHFTKITAAPLESEAEETALMHNHRITHLVARDSGGVGNAKIAAARAAGVAVILIERPEQPPCDHVASVPEAVAWLKQAVAFRA